MSEVLIRPLLTEKVMKLSEEKNQYAFEVHREATKEEIKKAVEEKFGVKVVSVRTANIEGKRKVRFTRKGLQVGKKPDIKKAYVTLDKDSKIDYYAASGGSSGGETPQG
ncbi:MAG: 50S ribosomal protein L23 [Chloroherpetonaceae bacterium]|nr:50S ribosomal protein L23 [Chloroherpetonaceae bacterium]MCS7212238.1 50S ribosomal protein L23 [Chloroherpetonaceae bacterium]MDW8018989.1 50S ribosomal protein L23 [Chloroherpetonaceae bacterium]MDW8464908.1 50S ribosomal protein L23 [Chloroherpetonaceae bacterium]